MKRIFICTSIFLKEWYRLKLTEEDLRQFENVLIENPHLGPLIVDTGGARKARFARANQGKSKGFRIIYVNFDDKEKIYFLFVYPKNEEENLTVQEKKELYKLIKKLSAAGKEH